MRSQSTDSFRQSDSEWEQHLVNAGCLGFVWFLFLVITGREKLDLRKGLFSLFLSFFFFHCGLSCYLCSRLVIWEACPCLTFEKFTVLFPPCHYLAP